MKLVGDKLQSVRGGRIIFSELSFSVNAGKSLLISGMNGAGKTTLLRIIAGFLKYNAGTLSLEGRDKRQAELTIGQCAHYIGHQNAIKSAMTVFENLSFWAHYLGTETTKETILECLRTVELDHAAQFSASILSAGQKRRLNLARLLIAPRPLWLLDEPSSALDKQAEKILCQMIKAQLKRGGLVMASSHENFGMIFDKELKLTKARMLA